MILESVLVLEPIPTESCWYLVSNEKLGDISVAGDISQNGFETQNLMSKLLTLLFCMSEIQ